METGADPTILLQANSNERIQMSAVYYPTIQPYNVFHKGRKEWGIFIRQADYLTEGFDMAYVYFPQSKEELLVSGKFLKREQ